GRVGGGLERPPQAAPRGAPLAEQAEADAARHPIDGLTPLLRLAPSGEGSFRDAAAVFETPVGNSEPAHGARRDCQVRARRNPHDGGVCGVRAATNLCARRKICEYGSVIRRVRVPEGTSARSRTNCRSGRCTSPTTIG